MDEATQKAIDWIRENPAYMLGYVESIESYLNEVRKGLGYMPNEPFIERFREQRPSGQ